MSQRITESPSLRFPLPKEHGGGPDEISDGSGESFFGMAGKECRKVLNESGTRFSVLDRLSEKMNSIRSTAYLQSTSFTAVVVYL